MQNTNNLNELFSHYRQAWEASEQRFQKIIMQNVDGLLVVNQEGIIRFVNPAAQKMLGHGEKKLIGERFGYPLLHGEKAELVILPQPGQTPTTAEMRVVEIEWQGEMCYLASLHDITERKIMMEALSLSERKYRAYINNGPAAVFVANRHGRYLEVNPTACQLSGYSEAELLQMSVTDLLAPEALKDGLAAFVQLLEQGQGYSEILCRHKNGSRYYLASNGVVLDEERVVSFCQDITERRHAEQLVQMQRDLAVMLSRSQDLFETLHRILVSMMELEEVDAGGIYLVDQADHSLRLQVHQGLSTAFINQAAYYPPR